MVVAYMKKYDIDLSIPHASPGEGDERGL